ncbi:MAG: DUF4231 domain-containing protein [Leptolyngbyaceae cyanobacterium T60_A2020_046]|nr:DUF4231 domain-containing protein [Leptolyngbyaceae cyanobacterium T60_A2020_046]
MPKKETYHDMLKGELSALVNELELPELYRQSMKARWLDQTLWTDKKATKCQKRYHFLRLTTVIGGVIIPALVAFNNFGLEETNQRRLQAVFPMTLFGLTQVVAVCTAVEEFFQYGLQWRQYRATAESLKSEGWQFFQLSGAYRKASTHLQAYPVFSTRVERIIRRDVQTYLSEVIKTDSKEDEEGDQVVAAPSQISPLSTSFFGSMGSAQTIEPLGVDDVIPTTTPPAANISPTQIRRPPMPPQRPDPPAPPNNKG